MRDDVLLPDSGFRIQWANLNNALFALICADPDLRAQYERANSAEAQEICSEQFDALAADLAGFIERFIVLD